MPNSRTGQVAERMFLSEEASEKVRKFSGWLRMRRYSANTVKVYVSALEVFLKYFSEKAVTEIGHEDFMAYMNGELLDRGLSASYQNQFVNAIKLFWLFDKYSGSCKFAE